jgi:hypothetical protein
MRGSGGPGPGEAQGGVFTACPSMSRSVSTIHTHARHSETLKAPRVQFLSHALDMAFALNTLLVLVPYLLSKPTTHESNMVMSSTHAYTVSLQFHLTSGPVRLRLVWDQHHRSQAAETKDQTAGLVSNPAATAAQTDCGPDQRPVLRPVLDRTAGTL